MKKYTIVPTIIIIIIIVIIGIGTYFIVKNFPGKPDLSLNMQNTQNDQNMQNDQGATNDTTNPTTQNQNADTTTNGGQKSTAETVIGKSVDGNDIIAYHYGTGDKELLFVSGIHGGYEWNTILLAYQLMDYLKANPTSIPSNLKVTVIPVLNPDGLNRVVGTTGRFTQDAVSSSTDTVASGRFNGNTVDLNRNFDCDWQASAVWQNKTVSGGTSAFSEPESQAIKNYVETNTPVAVVAWYSAAGGVYSSSCHNGVSSETSALTKAFSKASGYPAYEDFNFYEITGDMINWLAKNNIPAISVLLTDHTNTEFAKNQKGIQALFTYYSK